MGGGGASLDIALVGDTLLKLRSYDGRNWSALTEAQFLEDEPKTPVPGDLLITEIHYNPQGSDEFEFIEIMNAGSQTSDLSSLRMEGGIEFLFQQGARLAPGEFLVVVENLDSFAERYQDSDSLYYASNIMIAGEWSGRLDDAGERIELKDSDGEHFDILKL